MKPVRSIVSMLVVCAIILSCLSSCGRGSREANRLLERIDSCVEHHPDSALNVLNRLDSLLATGSLRLEGEAQHARYALLKTQTRDKNWIDHTSDSLILAAVRYYDAHGSRREQMLAHYYHGCIWRNAQEYGRAYAQFLEAAQMAERLDDATFEMNILDISSVKVKVSVPETEINSITPSTPSTIRVEAIDRQFAGGYIEKGVQADALTHTYDIRIRVNNHGHRLLPGMVANVSFNTDGNESPGGKLLPFNAVQKSAEGSLYVWTVSKDSTVHRAKVDVGATSGNRIAIIGGLKNGQRVVTEGYQKLSEGTKVVY